MQHPITNALLGNKQKSNDMKTSNFTENKAHNNKDKRLVGFGSTSEVFPSLSVLIPKQNMFINRLKI